MSRNRHVSRLETYANAIQCLCVTAGKEAEGRNLEKQLFVPVRKDLLTNYADV